MKRRRGKAPMPPAQPETSNPSPGQTPPRELVYGVIEATEQLVFLPLHRARELALLRSALYTSPTWGAFRAALPRTVYAQVRKHLRENEATPGKDADPFDPEDIWGYCDGDWPGWPAQEMLEWMPLPVREAFGTYEASVINGSYLSLDPRQETAIVTALRVEGYYCTRDDTLVRLASGYAV